jgi:hypothetical protein
VTPLLCLRLFVARTRLRIGNHSSFNCWLLRAQPCFGYPDVFWTLSKSKESIGINYSTPLARRAYRACAESSHGGAFAIKAPAAPALETIVAEGHAS